MTWRTLSRGCGKWAIPLTPWWDVMEIESPPWEAPDWMFLRFRSEPPGMELALTPGNSLLITSAILAAMIGKVPTPPPTVMNCGSAAGAAGARQSVRARASGGVRGGMMGSFLVSGRGQAG